MSNQPKLPGIEDFDLAGKVILARVDHNVVGKKGDIKDAFRIDSTFGLIHYISAKGGFPILMSHVGRTYDKKTGRITTGPDTSVEPVAAYLNRKLEAGFVIPNLPVDPERGITGLDGKIMAPLLADLRARRIGGIYLPNTRWFAGEESKDDKTKALADAWAGLADIYVNDAFGSWQAHASTFDIAARLPACAGFLMQKELANLDKVLNPEAPFVAVVAGSKYDTKIGPLNKIYEKVDQLILGGVIYNAFLCAKYGIEVAGVEAEDVELARGLVEKDKAGGKILEPGLLVESPLLDRRDPARCRVVKAADFKPGQKYAYFLDVAPESFDDPLIAEPLAKAKTIFINAVMGFTPNFGEGSARMYGLIGRNEKALKLYGGGDTLTEFKNLQPGLYLKALDDPSYYFFTGGGAVLTAIEAGSPFGIKPVAALAGR
ncbi:phosphoglycerate kinase [Deltaproteobacteria bacterium OttesenSCG-928-M10]|nr:phosphoglycerate kinase [Deltaproteobacteria bacterium OttesenSCG-928-M10]